MLYYVIFAILGFILAMLHDYLCYCFMQEKKVSLSSLRQWWNGEIDKD